MQVFLYLFCFYFFIQWKTKNVYIKSCLARIGHISLIMQPNEQVFTVK